MIEWSIGILALLAIASPWLVKGLGKAAGIALAAVPAFFGVWFAMQLPQVAGGEAITSVTPWVPEIGLNLSFHLDGLALLFTLLVLLIGAGVLLFAGSYMKGHPQAGRFFSYLIGFMVSMLGLVLADNLLLLFIFWELTSITSYLLIGFDHERLSARKGALQALLTTGLGGLIMLAGLIMLGTAGGSFELSELQSVADHPWYPAIVGLLLAGAFTKSAQFPFHFWLPNAMEAPGPVSAYLHSSTMVKAGVYLIARTNPALAGSESQLWEYLLIGFGGTTMVVGAYLATRQTYYKRLLAYSTVSSLGIMTMLIGMGEKGAQAAIAYLLAHAMFKGCLFLVAAIVDHEAHEKDVDRTGKLFRYMPVTAICALIAALSMAGAPLLPLAGFVGKELMIKAGLGYEGLAALGIAVTAAIVLSGLWTTHIGLMTGWRPFWGKRTIADEPHAHEAPWPMLFAPVLLAAGSIVAPIIPTLFKQPLVDGGVASVLGMATEEHAHVGYLDMLKPTLALGLSAIAFAGGLVLYRTRHAWIRLTEPLTALDRVSPTKGYHLALDGMIGLASAQTKLIQNGYLRIYIRVTVLALLALGGLSMLRGPLPTIDLASLTELHLLDALLVGGIAIAGVMCTQLRSRLATVATLGVIGYAVATLFVLYGAPDLAMTQFSVDTLTVILFVLVIYHLPRFAVYTRRSGRILDWTIAITLGVFMALLVLAANSRPLHDSIWPYYNEHAMPDGYEHHVAYGRNIVNTILVDFRAFDTLGEILVLGLAALGVFTLLKLRTDQEEPIEVDEYPQSPTEAEGAAR